MRMARLLVLLGVLAGFTTSVTAQQAYSLGVGIADVTGPAAEVTFMGYARLEQKGGGIHLRQFSRAFIFDDGERRVVFVSVDVAMISYALQKEVLGRLQILFGRQLYTEQNVILSATHTHAAPGGYNQYLLYDISVLGFVKQSFDALVTGIVKFTETTRKHNRIVISVITLMTTNQVTKQ
ncbi:hypothetical protein B566_EDAN013058 [Ephemera danica]|nr:hypothetical protein B566_EDAN013058 [Ephemera danica]